MGQRAIVAVRAYRSILCTGKLSIIAALNLHELKMNQMHMAQNYFGCVLLLMIWSVTVWKLYTKKEYVYFPNVLLLSKDNMRKVQGVWNSIIIPETSERNRDAESILEEIYCTDIMITKERRGYNYELITASTADSIRPESITGLIPHKDMCFEIEHTVYSRI
jgi:hypothetical protein